MKICGENDGSMRTSKEKVIFCVFMSERVSGSHEQWEVFVMTLKNGDLQIKKKKGVVSSGDEWEKSLHEKKWERERVFVKKNEKPLRVQSLLLINLLPLKALFDVFCHRKKWFLLLILMWERHCDLFFSGGTQPLLLGMNPCSYFQSRFLLLSTMWLVPFSQ